MSNNVVDLDKFRQRVTKLTGGQLSHANKIDRELQWADEMLVDVNDKIGELTGQLIQAQESLKELLAYKAGVTVLKNSQEGRETELWDHSEEGDNDE